MFAKKNGVKHKKPILSKKKDSDVIKYFEGLHEFTSWEHFEVKWDVGMGDDIVAKANRLEKWFLGDKDKSEIVFRPDDYWEKEAERRNTSTNVLFMQECHHRGIELDEFFKLFF